jgi:UDP-glucose 4-epimerase
VRDYVHVDDLAEAHAAGLEHVRTHPEGGVFNLGTGRGYSVLEVVKAAQDVTGRRFAVEIQDRRPGDPPRLVASHDQATRVLGWRPAHSGLEEILETAWRWHQVRHGT